MDERREAALRAVRTEASNEAFELPVPAPGVRRLNVLPFVAASPRRPSAAAVDEVVGGGFGNVGASCPLRIAIVTDTYPPEFNETARAVAATVEGLRQRGHRVAVVRPQRIGEVSAQEASTVLAPGLPLPTALPLTLGLPIGARLCRHWRRRRPDLVHVATAGLLGASALNAVERLGIPATSDYRFNVHPFAGHRPPDWAQPSLQRWLNRFHARTALTFAPTAKSAARLRLAGVDRVAVVGSGVDTVRFSPAWRSAALRSAWGADNAAPVVLHVGALAEAGNVGLIARAFAEIRRCDRRARLVLIGDGPLRQALQRDQPEAVFAGALHGAPLAAAYASADVLLSPATTNQSSEVVLEGLASGLVVVAYDGVAAARHVDDGCSGYLVPADTECLFVVTATYAATRIGQHDPMRRQARQAALRCALPGMLDDFEVHLRAVLSGRSGPGASERRPLRSADSTPQALRC